MNELIAEATEFVATSYGCKEKSHMSNVRYQVWLRNTVCKNAFLGLKLKSLPPTTEAFEQQIKHAHFQPAIWKGVLDKDLTALDPTLYGWCKHDIPKALEPSTVSDGTEPAPQEILQMISCRCNTDEACSGGKCGRCFSAQLSCAEFCACQRSYCIARTIN